MKIVVFTPAVMASAIGRVAAGVTHALLASGHEVRVVRTELEPVGGPTHDFGSVPLVWDDEAVTAVVLESDLVVHHVGDNYWMHAGSIEWMQRLPGLLCLHDFFVGNLFVGWCQHSGVDPEPIVRHWYGEEVVGPYAAAMTSPDFIDRTADVAPMTEWLCSMAHGVVSHSEWAIDRVTNSCGGPVAVAPLPYEPWVQMGEPPARSPGSLFQLITVGHVNANKRISSVLRAIASRPALRSRTVYTVVGAVDDSTTHRLAEEARDLGVRLVLTNSVGDEQLHRIYAAAHAVAALRHPCLEAASASAIEAMFAARPVLVTRAGSYDELPDDCVIKIDVAAEEVQTADALERLTLQPDEATELGRRAADYARRTFRAADYAATVVEVGEAVLRSMPALLTARAAVEQLRRWGPSVDAVESEITRMFLELAAEGRS